jgi:hypothetical protein
MSSRTPIASEEDSHTAHVCPAPVLSMEARHIAIYVQTCMQSPRREWFVSLLLDSQHHLIEPKPYVLYQGIDCPVHHHVDTPAFFQHAKDRGVHTIVTARYHPHPPRIFRTEDFTIFDTFYGQVTEQGLRLWNHLTLTITGSILSWRDWGQPREDHGREGPGSLRRNLPALSLWFSAHSTAILMALSGSS